MRFRPILGALMILLGGIVLASGLAYHKKNDIVDLGAVRVSTDEKKPVPPWIGGVLALAGMALVFLGGRRNS